MVPTVLMCLTHRFLYLSVLSPIKCIVFHFRPLSPLWKPFSLPGLTFKSSPRVGCVHQTKAVGPTMHYMGSKWEISDSFIHVGRPGAHSRRLSGLAVHWGRLYHADIHIILAFSHEGGDLRKSWIAEGLGDSGFFPLLLSPLQ